MKNYWRKRERTRGATAIEYIVLLAAIGIMAHNSVYDLGGRLIVQLSSANEALDGGSAGTMEDLTPITNPGSEGFAP
ncbi:MAG: hypothetical protein DCC75_05620 [Proteobacteria bacterium]|nr:MAG: hypothetical protein DCC75_05620 [Pseudomonadota bacterium]